MKRMKRRFAFMFCFCVASAALDRQWYLFNTPSFATLAAMCAVLTVVWSAIDHLAEEIAP